MSKVTDSLARNAALFMLALALAFSTQLCAEEVQTQKAIKQGVVLELYAPPLTSAEEARLRFRLTDETSGKPISGLSPAGWMDLEKPGAKGLQCKDRIQSYLQGVMAYRPDVNLNAWYILTLNDSASVTVIDPLGGYGGQNTLAMPTLPSRADDAVASPDRKHIYLSSPAANQIAVLDTSTWKITGTLNAGPAPRQVAMQPDRLALWVANDAKDQAGGVTVLDPSNGKLLKRFTLGPGPHRFAFDARAQYAAITGAGSVSLVDVNGLREHKRLKASIHPTDIAYSPLADAFLSIDAADGSVDAVDARRGSVRQIADLGSGLRTIRFTPDGRWGFILNQKENRGYVLDASDLRIRHRFETPQSPYQVTFSDTMAFIRGGASERFSAIALEKLNAEGELPQTSIAGGSAAPAPSADLESDAAMSQTPEGNSVLISNASDRNVYFFSEGMNAPQGSYVIKGAAPRGVLVLDRSLQESAPGEYTASVTPPNAGRYTVALLAPRPHLWHCFEVDVAPGKAKSQAAMKARLEFIMSRREYGAGEPVVVKVRASDGQSGQALRGVTDLEVLGFKPPGLGQQRAALRESGDGVYEATLHLSQPGKFLLHVRSASLHLDYTSQSPLTLLVNPLSK